MSSTTEQIKERMDIVDVISSYLKLEKAGKNFKARCPFHTEKTPSFFVSPERETYHCFGCNKGGDIFSFVEEIEGLDFPGALKVLAERAGVEISPLNQKDHSEKKSLYEILDAAVLFFQLELQKRKDAEEYLMSRALTKETIQSFRIGFAPPLWRALHTFLKEKGYSEKEIIKTGLISESQGKLYDRFRGRIMFPITDSVGRTIAFSGRIFEEMTEGKEPSAKYINSPETVLYNKSKVLYAFDKAKMAIRKADSCIVVEGQMDVILSHQAGFTHTVAASGTALTEDHLLLIKRLTKNIILSFDADEAGERAGKRSIHMALSSGLDVSVAHLPEGMDPAELVERKEEKKLETCFKDAKHVILFYLDTLSLRYPDLRQFQLNVEKEVLPFIAYLQSPIEQAHFIKILSERLKVSEDPIWSAVKKYRHDEKTPVTNHTRDNSMKSVFSDDPEEARLKKIQKHVHGILLWQENQKSPDVNIEYFKKKYEDIHEESFINHMRVFTDDEKQTLMFEMECAHQNGEHISEVLEELFFNLHGQLLRIKLKKTMELMKKAEETGNEGEVKKIFAECHALSQKINEQLTPIFKMSQ
ncbi:MAG: DNA primase [bacterium]|nr:DNA primase [bacterium]